MSSQQPPEFLLGVVEGFYGRGWSHDDRLAFAGLAPALGFNAHLHCPKSDVYLRKRWREHWPAAQWQQLAELAAENRRRGVSWGVGLSPFELYRCYDQGARKALRAKVEQLNDLGAGLLGLLFDDMPGNIVDLAARQADIVADVREWSGVERLLMCPTYYSTDPVLERFFGAMPEDYWCHLGAALAPEVEVFWTGPEVCSKQISGGDLEPLVEQLQRPLVLWDNYPVNDGAQRSKHLYLDPLPGREARAKSLLRGHFCNPMSQAYTSLPALSGLAKLYGGGGAGADDAWLAATLEPATWQLLQDLGDEFRDSGLEAMSAHRRRELAARFDQAPGPAAREVAGWLRGEYTFDPACLTD